MANRTQDPGDVHRSQTDQAVHAVSGYLQELADHSPTYHPGMSTAGDDVPHNPGMSADVGHDSSYNPAMSHDPNHDSGQNPGLSHDHSAGDSHHATGDPGAQPGHDPGAAAADAGAHDAGYHP